MADEITVAARIPAETERLAADVLAGVGLSVSEAIALLMQRIVEDQRLPFDARVPNAATSAAIEELEAGQGRRFPSADALFDDLGI